jgi:acyl carrier protein
MSATTVDREELRTLVAGALELPVEEVTDDASFPDELEVDSLTALEVAVQIEKRYGVKFSEPELKQLTSLNAAYDLLDARVAAQV